MNLPGIQGMEVLRRLREWFTRPIMIISVLNDEATIVEALDLGADDYLTKPFGVPELVARVRVCFRHGAPEESLPVFKSGGLAVDLNARTVQADGREVHLTGTEYNLLKLFIRHAGKVLTHHYILRESGSRLDTGRAVSSRLHRTPPPKAGVRPNRPEFLITEPGIGYRLQVL